MEAAKVVYEETMGLKWKQEKAWMVLKNHPKWRIVVEEYGADKISKKKNSDERDLADTPQSTMPFEGTNVLKRPLGCKSALAGAKKDAKKSEREDTLQAIALAMDEKNNSMKEHLRISEIESHREERKRRYGIFSDPDMGPGLKKRFLKTLALEILEELEVEEPPK